MDRKHSPCFFGGDMVQRLLIRTTSPLGKPTHRIKENNTKGNKEDVGDCRICRNATAGYNGDRDGRCLRDDGIRSYCSD